MGNIKYIYIYIYIYIYVFEIFVYMYISSFGQIHCSGSVSFSTENGKETKQSHKDNRRKKQERCGFFT